MTPFYFGTGQRRLFGVLDPAETGAGRGQAAVICYPWGPEYIFAHRALRHLSRQLAARGFNVLRFDYYGSGDSAGDETEMQFSGLLDDISAAIDELKDISEAKAVALIGLRLGGSLAAQISANQPKDVASLVLWDPAISGPEYLDVLEVEWLEMAQRHNTYLGNERERKRGARYGLPITDELAMDVGTIDLISIADKLPSRTLCLSTAAMPSHSAWRAALEARYHDNPIVEIVSDIHPWVEGSLETVGRLPLTAIGRIVRWLAP